MSIYMYTNVSIFVNKYLIEQRKKADFRTRDLHPLDSKLSSQSGDEQTSLVRGRRSILVSAFFSALSNNKIFHHIYKYLILFCFEPFIKEL